MVEGCDNGTFGSTCRQGWSPAAIIQIAQPNGPAPLSPPTHPPPSCLMTITAGLLGRGTETVIDVKGQGFAKSHSAWARATDATPGSPTYGRSNYSPQVQSDPGGGLSLKMAQPCKTGLRMDVAASDGTENPQASFNVCWSNVVTLTCQ
jgi:hypothetical protein